MRFSASFNPFTPDRFKSWQQWAASITTGISRVLDAWASGINGQITFGNGSDIDNIAGQWVSFTSDASGGTETEISHTLGVIPVGFLVANPPASGTVNRGSTSWTEDKIYITCSANSQEVLVFVLAPPETA